VVTTNSIANAHSDAPIGVVRVTVMPNTIVTGHGRKMLGQTAVCKTGDVLTVGTELDVNGNRVATWVIANLYAGMVWITSTNGRSIEFTRGYDMPDNDVYRALIMPYTMIDVPGGTGDRGLASLQPNDYIHFVGTLSSPNPDAGSPMWASALH
jgi:hypothetical protein